MFHNEHAHLILRMNRKFIIVGLQNSKTNNRKRDPRKFDSMNVENIRVKLNVFYYPDEFQNLNFLEGNCSI